MASEAAKELARKQKGRGKRPSRRRKKHTPTTSDWGTIRQIRETYKLTAEHQPRIGWMLAGAVLGPVVVGVVVGLLVGTMLIFWILLGLLAGLTVALFVLQRQAKMPAPPTRPAAPRWRCRCWTRRSGTTRWRSPWTSRANCAVHRAIDPAGSSSSVRARQRP